jgi:RNA polymerase sigma factor (sigma-70 family)
MTPARGLVSAPSIVATERGACVDWPARAHAAAQPVSGERELIRRAQGGSADAYAELIRSHQRLAFHAAWMITQSPHDAAEALQEGLFKAYRALPRFRAGEPFRPWLLRIVTNEAYTLLRNRSRRAALHERAQRGTREDWSPSPEDRATATEASDTLRRALEALPDRDRRIITCRYLLDLSEAETAIALRCRRGTVKSRLSRALERLRTVIESGEFEALK